MNNSMPMPMQAPATAAAPAPSHDDVDRVREHKQGDDHKRQQTLLAQQAGDQAGAQVTQQQQERRDRTQSPQGDAGPQPQRESNAEVMSQVQERLVRMNAMSASTRRQVDQIRKQQEASGLGLRGDVDSAESLLESYLNAARSDVDRGDALAARQDLNKAQPELQTLQKFLGR
jgi:serine/threonine-protein kinase